MPVNGKRLVDSALSTAMMVAFANPEGGAAVGAGIAGFQFLFDTFWDFVTPPSPVPPPLTQAELQTALGALKADVIDAIWKNQADAVTDDILALHQSFLEVWQEMGKFTLDGERYVLMVPDKTTQQSINHLWSYFDLQATSGLLTRTRTYRNAIQNSSLNDPALTATQVAEHRTRTTGLYCLVSSLAVSYLKAAALWNWGNELLEAWQYQEYQKQLAYWNQQNAAYQALHSLKDLQAKYPGLNLDPGYAPPTWNHWIAEPGCPVPALLQEVRDLLDYCVQPPNGLYTQMRAHWDEYDTLMHSHDVPLPPVGITQAQMLLAVAEGQKRATERDALLEKYALANVVEDDILKFGQNIEAWRAAAASVDFQNYTVVEGDTLTDIARRAYGDPKFVDSLFAVNQSVVQDANVLAAGMTLKIYSPQALPYVTLPAKGA